MLKTFGSEIQDELFKYPPFEKGEARLIQIENKNLIFARPFDYKIKLLTILGIENCIKNALKICDTQGFKNIAITALSGNYLPNSNRQINDITHITLKDYFQKNLNSKLEEVFLVNYDKKVFKI